MNTDAKDLNEMFDTIKNQLMKNSKSTLVRFAWDIDFSPAVSNSHSSPVGCPQNFTASPNLPKSYPGYAGRVWFSLNKPLKGFGDSVFNNTRSHTGTGGYGTYAAPWTDVDHIRKRLKDSSKYPDIHSFSYEYKIFTQDWPNIFARTERLNTFHLLQHERSFKEHNRQCWIEQDVIEDDNHLLWLTKTIT